MTISHKTVREAEAAARAPYAVAILRRDHANFEAQQAIREALKALEAYHNYGQDMRKIGRGFEYDWEPGAGDAMVFNMLRAALEKLEAARA